MNGSAPPGPSHHFPDFNQDGCVQRLKVPVADHDFGPAAYHQDTTPFDTFECEPEECQTLDDVTWHTLQSLREKACTFINSDGEVEEVSSSDSGQTPPTQCDVCLKDYNYLKVIQGLMDYEPESEFLKIVKEQFLAQNEQLLDIPPESRLKHFLPLACQDCIEQAERFLGEPYPENARPLSEGRNMRSMYNKTYPNTGRPTTSDNPRRRTWNGPSYPPVTKLSSNEPQLYKINENSGASSAPQNNIGARSEHVSRSKEPVKCGGRRKRKPDGTCQSQEYFEPNLKRPHERSCERCWRYASPARSPVNKPDQRYDPNFRKAHSCTDFVNIKDGSDLDPSGRHISPCKNLQPLPPRVPSGPSLNLSKASQRPRHRKGGLRPLSLDGITKLSATVPLSPTKKKSVKLFSLNESKSISPPATFVYEGESKSPKTKSNSPGSRMTSFFDFPDDFERSLECRPVPTKTGSPPGSFNKVKPNVRGNAVPSSNYKENVVQGPLKINPVSDILHCFPPIETTPQNTGVARNGNGTRSGTASQNRSPQQNRSLQQNRSPQQNRSNLGGSPLNKSGAQSRNASQNESSIKSTSPQVGSSLRVESFLTSDSPTRQGSPNISETIRSTAAVKGSPPKKDDSMLSSPNISKLRRNATLGKTFNTTSTEYAEIRTPRPKKSSSPRKSTLGTPRSSKGGRRSKSSTTKARSSRAARRLDLDSPQKNLPEGNPVRTQSWDGLPDRTLNLPPCARPRSRTPNPRPMNIPPHPVHECRCAQMNNQNIPQETFIRNSMPPGGMPPGSMPPGSMPPGSMPPGSMPPGGMPSVGMPPVGMPSGGYPPGSYASGPMPPGSFPQGNMSNINARPIYCCHCGSRRNSYDPNYDFTFRVASDFGQTGMFDYSNNPSYGFQPNNPILNLKYNPNEPEPFSFPFLSDVTDASLNRQEGIVNCPYRQSVPRTPLRNQTFTQNTRQTLDNTANFQPLASSTPINPNFYPRKYCVFYMTKSKEENGKEVEVLVEELTQKCSKQDTTPKSKDITDKMKKVEECPSESMALRFQKGVSETCKNTPSSRLLYF